MRFRRQLVAGEIINPAQREYGDRHEAELWREFQAEMNGKSIKNWMYNGSTAKDRPGDLGYYMGYRIARSHYDSAENKDQAIHDILSIQDFPDFLRRSRYAERSPR